MDAAVAKAPEKNKVPGSPQVLGDSSFHSDTEGSSPYLTFLNELFAIVPTWGLCDTSKTLPGKNESVCENHHTQKTKVQNLF